MSVPILCYHAVADDPEPALAEFCVTPAALAAHLQFLRRHGYRSFTVAELVTAFQSGADVRRAVVLTFDDGYQDTVTEAAPLLERHGFRATVFVVSELVGGRPPIFSGRPLASWAQLRSLHQLGWEIGLHSATHPDLTLLDEAGLTRELVTAREVLEANSGRPVESVAYPWGRYSPPVMRAVARSGARAAVTVSHALATASSDQYALPRCVVRRTDSVLDLWLTVRTGMTRGSIVRFVRRQWTAPADLPRQHAHTPAPQVASESLQHRRSRNSEVIC